MFVNQCVYRECTYIRIAIYNYKSMPEGHAFSSRHAQKFLYIPHPNCVASKKDIEYKIKTEKTTD
ncbi:10769_t:CDS:2 [Gigaspora margarita]|uniref:10769_t:CDS:1 n=1 Tax=Gigaspora margarita TaxID=4874 RepID=A0ABN7UHN2_GIGMA|nr:10769_t:CDS:2 [Gigaspora margarita]